MGKKLSKEVPKASEGGGKYSVGADKNNINEVQKADDDIK